MEDLIQVLRDFVATSNSGKYQDEATLLSKFPELSGYDPQVLKDFVATSNSGKYATEEELISKFPEFGQPVKKKEESSTPLWLQKQAQPEPKQKPEPTLPFLESKPSGISLGSPRVPEAKPMFEAPPMRTPEQAQQLVKKAEEEAPKQEDQGWLMNTVSSLDRGFYKNLIGNPVKGIGTLLEGATGKVFGGSGKGPISDALIQFGDWYNNAIDELTPQDEAYKNSLSDQFGQAFGQVASLVLTGGVSGAGKEGAAVVAAAPKGVAGAVGASGKQLASSLANPTAVSAGLSMGQAEFDRAKQAGATDDQAFEAFYKNAAVGSVLEQIPVMQFLKRFNKSTAGGVANYIKTKGVAGLTGGFEEMTTEVLQQLYANKSAQDIYNMNQEILEGVGESGGVGFGVGFLLNAMGARAKVLRKEGKPQEAAAIEAQINQFESKPQGPPPSYSINGVNVQDAQVINDMIDNMDAEDLSKSNIEISNNPELSNKLQDKIVTSSIKEQVRQANPDLDEATLDQITALEKELNKFEGNKTQTAKDKAAAIRSQIKTLQENAVQKPSTEEGVLRPEEPQVGLQEVGEGDAQEQAPAEEVVQEEVITTEQKAAPPTDEEIQAAFDRLGMPEDVETLPGIDDELNKINESIGRVKEEGSAGDDERTLMDLGDKIARAKRNVASAEDTDAAIEELKQAQKERDDFEQSIEKRKNFNTVDALISEEIYQKDRDKETYEYQELFDQDPRLAALQSAKDMVEFLKTEKINEDRVSTYENHIKVLEEDIAKFPVKEAVSPATPKVQETPAIEVRDEQGNLVEEIRPQPIEIFDEDGNLISTTAAATPRAKSVPIPVAIPKPTPPTPVVKEEAVAAPKVAKTKAVAPAKEEVTPVKEVAPAPTTKAVGPEALRQEYIDKTAEVRLNKDKSRTPKQIEERIAELKAEYQKLKAEMTAPKPKAKAEAKPSPVKVVSKKVQEEIKALEDEIAYHEGKVDEAIEEIGNTSYNLKEAIAEAKKESAELKGKKMSKEERQEAKDDIEIKLQQARDEHDSYMEQYKDQKSESSKAKKQAEAKLAKLKAKQEQAPTVVEEEVSSYDEAKDLDPNDETGLKKLLNYLDRSDASLSEFERGNLSMGMAIPLAKAIIKSLKVLVKAGITLQEAIKRVAAERNMEEKEIVSAIMELDRRQRPMTKLKDQIKAEIQSAKAAKKDLNQKRKDLSSAITEMEVSGRISSVKAKAIINKIGNLNLDSKVAVDKFIDYVEKIFADAEYSNKLNTANNTRSQLRKLSKNKDKFANLRDLASKFVEIDPSMVEDIDKYNEVASLINDSIKGSTTRKADVKLANMIKESDAMTYINKTMEAQQKMLLDQKAAEVEELLDIDTSDLTYEQLVELVDTDKPLTKYNEGLIRAAINKAFEVYSSIIKASIRNNKDVFTDEDVKYTDNQKKIVNEFMDMDLNLLSPKQALESVDALMNFLQNQSISKMESVLAKYKGEVGMREIEDKGIKAKPISKYWSKGLGRLLLEQTANLNIVFERIFGGFTKGSMVEDAMGITALKNGKSKAQSESNSIVNKYVDKFYKLKPNGQAFNTAFNNIERGLVAFMSRNVIGTDSEMNAEFNRRKGLIKESIAKLEEGNEQEVAKAKVYQEVYDKILKDSETIEQVQSKAAEENLEAVKFWQQEWLDKYDQLSDTALGVYNKVLEKDINYTPDRFSKLSSDAGDVDLTTEDMGFLVNSGTAPLYKKETGVLMAATRPETLPKNTKTLKTNRYIDLSFDNNNSNAMYDALVDINTAAPIRQVQSALNSDSFSNIMKGTGDERLLRNRIDLYVKNIRNKNPFSNDEFSRSVKSLNRLASIGVGQALGGVLQPIKQVIPIATNTLVNAGNLDINSVSNKAKQEFIDRSGYAIANRGVESQAQIETLNKMIDEAAKSKAGQAFKQIEKINNWWLKTFLVKFDVAIARASWMTYYEQSLKKQGIDPSTIDYTTHEVNEQAAEYAQSQVDRQQNVSDADLAGALLSDKDASKQLFVKVLMPFASFRMNQSARLGSDLATVTNKTATEEDKKIAYRSIVGFTAEMATFRLLSAGSALLIASLVKGIMGRGDDEEKDKKKNDAIIKGQLTSTVADVFSPAPLLDKGIQVGASAILDATQDALDVSEEDRFEIYSGNKQDFFQSLGLLGIAGGRASQLYEMSMLAAGAPYKDNYGRKKYLLESDREAIATLIPFALVSNIGLAPSEVNSIVRSSLAEAKRSGSTVESKESKSDDTKIMDLNKSELKRYYPEIYEQYYGEGTQSDIERELKSKERELEREMKDEYYQYTPKEKVERRKGISRERKMR